METSRLHGQRSVPTTAGNAESLGLGLCGSAQEEPQSRQISDSALQVFRPLPSSRIQRQFRALDQRNLPRTVDAGFYQPPMLLGGLTRIGEAERPDPAQRDRQHSLERLVVGHDQSVLARGLQQKT